MQNATTNVIAKVAAAVAGLGLVLSALAPMAMAQTTTTTTTTSTTATFTRDLTIGSTGADVTALQNWLISKGHSIAAGATGYFGTQTKAALAAYQAANGISPAAGYFGPITRAKVGMGGTTTTGGTTTSTLSGGEADLSDYDITREESSGSEGESEVEVFTVEFDVEDGDVLVERLEILASSTNSTLEERPWQYFDRVSIMVDGKEVADMDVDERDMWDDEDGQNAAGDDIYRLTLTGLDIMVEEGDMAEITVAFDIAGSIDTNDLAQDFVFMVPEEGIRAVDAEGIQQYIGDNVDQPWDSGADTVTFGFDAEETGDLSINSSSDDPDSTFLISDEDDESDDYTVFVFELENDDDVDSLVTDLNITVATTGMAVSALIESATLVIDGDEFDGDITSATGVIEFEDIDVVIDADESVDVEIMVTLAEDAVGTIDFSVAASGVTAESNDSGEEADVSGSASSETHSVGLTGVDVDGTSTSSDTNDTNTIGTFRITFDVTAAGDEDVYIYNGADQGDNDATPFSAMASTTGIAYNLYNGSGVLAATTSDSALITSGADMSGNFFRVDNGETESFTLTVTLDPAAGTETSLYYVELDAIRFDDNSTLNTSDDDLYTIPDEAEFQTDAETLSA